MGASLQFFTHMRFMQELSARNLQIFVIVQAAVERQFKCNKPLARRNADAKHAAHKHSLRDCPTAAPRCFGMVLQRADMMLHCSSMSGVGWRGMLRLPSIKSR